MASMAETGSILNDTLDGELITPENLGDHVGDKYKPSPESLEELRAADFAAITGQVTSAGKSALIGGLVAEGLVDIPSRTSRLLREGEIDGVHKIHTTLADLALGVSEGDYLEIEEVREGVFYATQLPPNPSERYIKDMELKGVLNLRQHVPMKAVFPLPPLDWIEGKQVTEWERRHVLRDGFTRPFPERAIDELRQRLMGVVEEITRVEDLGLVHRPDTLLVVNRTLSTTVAAAKKFLLTGEKTEQDGIEEHLQGIRVLATKALEVCL